MSLEHIPTTADAMLADDVLLEAVARQHGTSVPQTPEDLNGTLQHLVSPLVGMLSFDVRDAAEPTPAEIHLLGRLSLVAALLEREQHRVEGEAR